jgi:hypothetical protein
VLTTVWRLGETLDAAPALGIRREDANVELAAMGAALAPDAKKVAVWMSEEGLDSGVLDVPTLRRRSRDLLLPRLDPEKPNALAMTVRVRPLSVPEPVAPDEAVRERTGVFDPDARLEEGSKERAARMVVRGGVVLLRSEAEARRNQLAFISFCRKCQRANDDRVCGALVCGPALMHQMPKRRGTLGGGGGSGGEERGWGRRHAAWPAGVVVVVRIRPAALALLPHKCKLANQHQNWD